jgi:cytidylate kinase
MSVVIISSDNDDKAREIAEKTAETLEYSVLDREVLNSVAAKYEIPVEKLQRALDEVPSFLGMSTKTRALYLAYIEEAALAGLSAGNMVCHGLAAHLYVIGVSHVLKVRILADPEERVRHIASREGVTKEKAAKFLRRQESLRRRWSRRAYQRDETDASLYDMVISLSQIDSNEAVKTITETARYPRFKPMTYSIKCMKDKELATRVRAVLMADYPDARVRADGTTVVVETNALKREKRKKAEKIKELAGRIPGVDYVEVHVINDLLRQAAESFR